MLGMKDLHAVVAALEVADEFHSIAEKFSDTLGE